MKVIYPVSVQAFPVCGTSLRLVLNFLSALIFSMRDDSNEQMNR